MRTFYTVCSLTLQLGHSSAKSTLECTDNPKHFTSPKVPRSAWKQPFVPGEHYLWPKVRGKSMWDRMQEHSDTLGQSSYSKDQAGAGLHPPKRHPTDLVGTLVWVGLLCIKEMRVPSWASTNSRGNFFLGRAWGGVWGEMQGWGRETLLGWGGSRGHYYQEGTVIYNTAAFHRDQTHSCLSRRC